MKAVVGLSGGVDSSVSALLLKRAGFDVMGLFMKNWNETDENGICPAQRDYEDVLRLCKKIDIPFYSVDFSKEYEERVFSHFLKEYEEGFTPNPDILCNKEIKFCLFYEKAKAFGADFIATGHYARIENNSLLKGLDPQKDQSYFLYTIKAPLLKEVLFPVGALLKSEVRKIAKEADLPTAEKKESMGICFIGKRNFRPFLAKYLGYKEGPILDLNGNRVGTHLGSSFYTIGQRQGLCIGGKGEAWYVVKKDVQSNTLFVAQGENHPALFSETLVASELSFVNAPPRAPFACKAKIRYRQQDQDCIIETLDDKAFVRFLSPQRAVTKRQSIVFYQGDICLGGGIIS